MKEANIATKADNIMIEKPKSVDGLRKVFLIILKSKRCIFPLRVRKF